MKPGSSFSAVCRRPGARARSPSPRVAAGALALASRRVAAGALALAAACGGAGGAGDAPPAPVLSTSRTARAELRGLVERFANGSHAERIALEPDLVAFRRRHLGDDLVRTADVHLAWIALERGDLSRAASMAALVASRGRGITADIAQVIRGAALRRGGKPARALEELRPLVGKLIDAYVRALLNEEVVLAALESRAWSAAVDLMGVWLREASDDERSAVKARIAAQLPAVPPEELARLLRGLRPAEGQGDLSDPELDLRGLLAVRLAEVARERRDVQLAQELLATSGALLGKQGDAIAQLASGTRTARVEAPTVGLLLSLRTPATRRRGVEIAAGVAHGLGLPGSSARLVSRDDGGDAARLEDALASLTADGAAVIIAGTDREDASAAAAFARSRDIPVLLLHPPDPAAVSGAFVFVVGEELAGAERALAAALAERGTKPVAVVTNASSVVHTTNGSPVAVTLSCDGLLEPRALRSAGVQGLVLGGDTFCAERALAAFQPLPARSAFGLEATDAAPPGALVATAGDYPFDAYAIKSVRPADPDALAVDVDGASAVASLPAWAASHPAPPGWWAALGRDAGLLAWAGVRGLPALGTEDPAEVKRRRLAAASAVAGATTDLWTTAARGFGGARVLPREVGSREVSKSR